MEKSTVYKACLDELESHIDELQKAVHVVHESMVGEDKSTAGDKYETARAMAQNEFVRLSNQLDVLKADAGHLQIMHVEDIYNTVQMGALVQTESRWIYIATGLGKLEVGDQSVIAISPSSPLAQAFMSHSAGETVEFHGQKEKIIAVS
jgi:transcription elongation GreA/GreB family factor